MSSEQRPIQPAHSQVPEIPQELLTARTLGSYENVPPGESFKLYFENGPRFIEPGTAAVKDKGHNTQHFTFRRLSEEESVWSSWKLRTTDGETDVQIEGSSTYFERDAVLGGVVVALQCFNFRPVSRREMTVTAPDGDTLTIPVGEPGGRITVGPVFSVEWPWGLSQVTSRELNYQSK